MDFTHFTAVQVFDHPDMTPDQRRAWINVAPYDELIIADRRTAGRPEYNELILRRIQLKLSEQIVNPHWTITPNFIVGLFALIFSAIAAFLAALSVWPELRFFCHLP